MGEDVEKVFSTFVFWKFKGETLLNSSKHYTVNDFYTHEAGSTPKVRTELTLLNLSYEDSGNYSCVVKYGRGIKSDTVILEVVPRGMKPFFYVMNLIG